MSTRKIECSVPKIMFLLLLSVGVIKAAPQQRYDLLLKGGHVIDPQNGIDGLKDVAISQGKIAAVADAIPASQAEKVVNVSGLYVVPGLIDLHTHLYATSGMLGAWAGDSSVLPDGFSFRTGATTMVDA